MTPDEYNKKYNLSLTTDFNVSNLVIDLLKDFYDLNYSLGCETIKEYYQNISLFRITFNKISNRSIKPENWLNIWGKFFIKTKDLLYEMFPEEKERVEEERANLLRREANNRKIKREREEAEELRKKETRERRAREKQERRQRAEHEQRQRQNRREYQYQQTYSSPSNSYSSYFSTLNLTIKATSDEVKKNYRKLAMVYHPDKSTGNQTKFVEVTKAKEKCLSYIKNTR